MPATIWVCHVQYASHKYIKSRLTHEHHRCSLGDHESQHHIAHLALPQGIHTGITGLTLMPTIPAEVVIGPITVLLTVCIVMLPIVGNKVIQGEAVMRNDEVDALVGLPARTAHVAGDAVTTQDQNGLCWSACAVSTSQMNVVHRSAMVSQELLQQS